MAKAQQQSLVFNPRQMPDGILLCLWLALVSIGLVMVASSSVAFAAANYGDEWFFLKRHGVFLIMAFVGAGFVYFIPTKFWQRYSVPLMVLGLLILVAVLIPGLGKKVNGSQRWIDLGFFTLQASEIMKFSFLMFFASYFAKYYPGSKLGLMPFLKAIAILALVVFLLLLEPDLGSTVVLSAVFFGMIFIAGIKIRYILAMLFASVALFAPLIYFSPYRLKRLISYQNPWADQFNDGYQLTQSLIAFGRGEWFGVGLGNSLQKLFYLPEAHTDFIFAVFAEEFGLLGVLVVIGIFAVLIVRILGIVRVCLRHGNIFLAYAVFGIATLFSLQLFINIGVTSGLLPTKGLTLPFISYGGNSLIVSCALMGFVMRANFEMQKVMPAISRVTNPSRVKMNKRAATVGVMA